MSIDNLNLAARFSGIFNPAAFLYNVLIVGAGSVGSNVALHLAKMGIRDITVIDRDTISMENIGVSLVYGFNDIGKPKVNVLKERIKELTDTEINAINDIVTEKTNWLKNHHIVIAAVDTITARKNIINSIINGDNIKTLLYIDTAMGGMNLTAEAIDIMNNANHLYEYTKYINSLSETDIPDLPCAARSTLHGTSILASYVQFIIIQYAANGKIQTGEKYKFNLTIFDKVII